MLIPIGFFGAGGDAGSYELISTAYGTGSSGTISFTSIPSTYKHLQVRFTARGTDSILQLGVRFNNDTSTNYSAHALSGSVYNGSGSVGASAYTSSNKGPIYLNSDGTAATANTYAAYILDVLDYADTSKYKTTRGFGGRRSGGNENEIALHSGSWRNTAAITRLDLVAESGNITSPSRFSLYGIKG